MVFVPPLDPVPHDVPVPEDGRPSTIWQDPDRIDGYRPVRQRLVRTVARPGAPYPTRDDPGQGATVVEFEHDYRDRGFDVFLVGADRARKEINLKSLTPAERTKYDEAMAKEWKNWLIFEAVSVVDADKIPKNAQIVTTRWVHTDKNSIARSSGKKVPLLAKSRLVVQGHKETGNFRSDSQTASLLAFNLVCSCAASKTWNWRGPERLLAGRPVAAVARASPATSATGREPRRQAFDREEWHLWAERCRTRVLAEVAATYTRSRLDFLPP